MNRRLDLDGTFIDDKDIEDDTSSRSKGQMSRSNMKLCKKLPINQERKIGSIANAYIYD